MGCWRISIDRDVFVAGSDECAFAAVGSDATFLQRIELINALQEGRVAADSSKRAFIGTGDKYVAVDADTP
ncbi:urea ABC transporter permease subunit UrtB, partial [Pseudomonas quasicaspiana]|nr:urea ABC transporter permease subunit UrtB [Pseudomonas quasicaspiana]